MRTPRLSGDYAGTVALLAVGWLLGMLVLDLLLPLAVAPDPLFAIAPLIACSVLSPRATAGFGVAAVLALVWSGWWNQTWESPQQWIRLLDVILVSVAAVLVAIVRVHRERRLTRVTAIAEAAQRVILPTVPVSTGSVQAASRYLSAAEDAVIGGDLYDCSVTQGFTRFIVGDVRGKGLEAVEQAARVIRAFRQAAATKATLADAVHDMNSYLTPFLGPEDFVTALLVDLTFPETVILTSCGHPPAILVRQDGSATFLEPPAGLPLGVGDDAEEESYPWAAGDRILLYTDGLSEARDADAEFLPLLDIAPMLATGSLDEALEALLARAKAHVPDGALGDDMAVLLLENTMPRADTRSTGKVTPAAEPTSPPRQRAVPASRRSSGR